MFCFVIGAQNVAVFLKFLSGSSGTLSNPSTEEAEASQDYSETLPPPPKSCFPGENLNNVYAPLKSLKDKPKNDPTNDHSGETMSLLGLTEHR